MTITVNGERRDVPDGMTVAALLSHLGITIGRVAVERNRDVLPRAKWNETRVEANDSYEIVQLVGGG
ncbi:MAG TPA: sulfur carrier protein ThiS [Candidatus Acidoferrales bacterium]